MNILYVTDDNYAMQSGISMISLLEHNKELKEVVVFIADTGISEKNRAYLKQIAESYDRELYLISALEYVEQHLHGYNMSGFSPVVMVRLFMTEYLPDTVEKILYLDGDTLVPGSLKDLDELNMGDRCLAAVPELYMPPHKKQISVGFKKEETYYNSGVLLCNLQKWREDHVLDTFMTFFRENADKLLFPDQDVLNYCFRGNILTLPFRYNFSTNLPYFPYDSVKKIQPEYCRISPVEYQRDLKHPVIIHYLGDERPWFRGNFNICRHLFEKYKKKTPWKDEPMVPGKELYMQIYHLLNCMTKICPAGRIAFSDRIGANKYKWFGKT